MLDLQVEAVKVAGGTHSAVHHPLLDGIRKCSSTPDAAADFFCAVLHPNPSARLTAAQALAHLYLQPCVCQMQASYMASHQASSPPALLSTLGSGIVATLASARDAGLKAVQSVMVKDVRHRYSSSRSSNNPDMAVFFP